MLIEPTAPHLVKVKTEAESFSFYLVKLNDEEVELRGPEYLEKELELSFKSEFFYGEGVIKELHFNHHHFNYVIQIKKITFQPGFLVNKTL